MDDYDGMELMGDGGDDEVRREAEEETRSRRGGWKAVVGSDHLSNRHGLFAAALQPLVTGVCGRALGRGRGNNPAE